MTKTVSLSDEAYERMKHWKKENESFSSVVMRYLPDTRPFKEVLKEYEKDRKGLTDEEADQMLKDIE
ncbi:antitoxin VapB family protein [Methanoplanus limicola]|nr:antitoxin VapB family protein [Methanoplanus limicola]